MNKTYIRILFLITLSLMLLSCESIKFKYAIGDSKKPLEQSFYLISGNTMGSSSVKDFYISKYYVSNFNMFNKHYVFTYSNDMNPKRIGMTEEMFPLYFKNLKYKMKVDVEIGDFRKLIWCSNIVLFYKDSLSKPNDFTPFDQEKIFYTIISLSMKDLELTY